MPTATDDIEPPGLIEEEYDDFIRDHPQFWKGFNGLLLLASIGCATGSILIIQKYKADHANLDEATDSDADKESILKCMPMLTIQYFLVALHVVNALLAIVNLAKLEKKMCFLNFALGVGVFEVIMFSWLQLTYFQAQTDRCMAREPLLYFFIMGQILGSYVFGSLAICFFLRKVCQDPNEALIVQQREAEWDRKFELLKRMETEMEDKDKATKA